MQILFTWVVNSLVSAFQKIHPLLVLLEMASPNLLGCASFVPTCSLNDKKSVLVKLILNTWNMHTISSIIFLIETIWFKAKSKNSVHIWISLIFLPRFCYSMKHIQEKKYIYIQSDTKSGNFWKTQQKLKQSKKKNLLTEIEPLQLAF